MSARDVAQTPLRSRPSLPLLPRGPRTELTQWQLGIFLCMRCAGLHRKLGTHISKVKSLSMDKWDNAQVDVSASGPARDVDD